MTLRVRGSCLAFGTALVGAVLLPVPPALAACTPAATGTGVPAPGTIVTCGSTTNQNSPNGYGSGATDQNGLTIVVESNATVTGINNGFVLGGNNVITNSGTIIGVTGLGIEATGAITITNFGTISTNTTGIRTTGTATVTNTGVISGLFEEGIRADTVILTNTGRVQGGTTGVFQAAVFALTAATIVNSGQIIAGAPGFAIAAPSLTLQNSGTIEALGSLFAVAGSVGTITNSGTITGSTGISMVGGGVVITNSGTITGNGVPANAIDFGAGNNNTLALVGTSVINGFVVGTGAGNRLRLGGTIAGTFNVSQIGAGQQYQGFALFEKTDTATWTLTGNGAQSWVIAGGTLIGDTNSLQGAALTNNATLTFNQAFNGAYAGVIAGTGTVTKEGAGIVTFTGANSYTGATLINGGTLRAGAVNVLGSLGGVTVVAGATLDLNGFNQTIGSLAGAGAVTLGGATLTAGGNNATTLFAGAIAGAGGLTKQGLGTLTLAGLNTYTGATTVTAGGLIVNGSIAASSGLAVNLGAFVGGTGQLPGTIINGTLAPGNSIGTITVNGNLAFGGNAAYLVELGATADRTVVTGNASLAGALDVLLTTGGLARSHTILTAAGGLTGTFGSFNITGLPAGFTASLGYSPTDVTLTLTAQLQQQLQALGFNGNRNQRAVAGALDDFFNGGGTLPSLFAGIFGLSGSALGTVLTQLSGELGTGAAAGGFRSMDQFLSLMLDPFLETRAGDGATPGRAIGFAPEPSLAGLPKEVLAFGPSGKADPAALVDRRWSAWGAGHGATARFNGDAAIGSSKLTATTGSFAAGIDYRLAPDAVIGVAIAGGMLNYGLDAGLGTGRGDTIQAGVYGALKLGAGGYLSAALAVARHDLSTDRTVAFTGITDQLKADFVAHSFGARVEGGHRLALMPNSGVTPYAALQSQQFRTPAYSERDVTGLAGGFALSYAAQTTRQTRSELGARLDSRLALADNAILVLQARGAWAHEFNVERSIHAVFQSLPGSGFTVIGAAPARNAALVSAGAELRLTNGVTLSGRFDGELADSTRIWGGSGTIRVAW